jgi:hypothetical protein
MGNATNTEQWAAMERLRFIERSAWWRGLVQRQDVSDVFGVGAAQVSADFQKYQELNPGALAYSLNRKRYEGQPGMVRVMDVSTLEDAVAQFIDRSGRPPGTGRVIEPGSNRVDWLVLPDRRAPETVERRVFHAVLHGMKLEVLYASAHGRSRKWRGIVPHALAWSGHRWHARAWCLENHAWQDFVLGRMEDARWPEPVDPLPVRDEAWDTYVTVEVRPHTSLDEEQQQAVATEFRMTKRRLKLRVRQAMVQYLESSLGLPPAEGEPVGARIERVR